MQEYKDKNYLRHLDINYSSHKTVEWHLTLRCELVLQNGSGEIVDLFLKIYCSEKGKKMSLSLHSPNTRTDIHTHAHLYTQEESAYHGNPNKFHMFNSNRSTLWSGVHANMTFSKEGCSDLSFTVLVTQFCIQRKHKRNEN